MPSSGHPVANPACAARALPAGVVLEGGEINGLALAEGEVLRTAEPTATRCGLAQVRRIVSGAALALVHVVFAPVRPRPLLLSLVRIENRSAELIELRYTELWDVAGTGTRRAEGACICDVAGAERALAEASSAVRARAPEPLPRSGLALAMRFALPAGARRELAFAYAAPEAGEPAAPLVRAWRGDVALELSRCVAHWRERLAGAPNTVAAYRVESSGWPS